MSEIPEKTVEIVEEPEKNNKEIEKPKPYCISKFEVFYSVLVALIIFFSVIGFAAYYFIFRENI